MVPCPVQENEHWTMRKMFGEEYCVQVQILLHQCYSTSASCHGRWRHPWGWHTSDVGGARDSGCGRIWWNMQGKPAKCLWKRVWVSLSSVSSDVVLMYSRCENPDEPWCCLAQARQLFAMMVLLNNKIAERWSRHLEYLWLIAKSFSRFPEMPRLN